MGVIVCEGFPFDRRRGRYKADEKEQTQGQHGTVHKERYKTIKKIIIFMVLKETLENYFTSLSHRLLTYKTRKPN